MPVFCLAIKKRRGRGDFTLLIQAMTMQITAHATAAEREAKPNGRETINNAGMKMNAKISSAAVAV
jgi:hypothetical protein